jgi:ligand-binding sensor domain-containing protein
MTRGGVFQMPVGEVRFGRVDIPQGDRLETFLACLGDSQGRIWVSGTNGLAVRDSGRWLRLTKANGLKSNTVRALAESPDGALWISYLEPAGLTRLTGAGSGKWVASHITATPSGLISDSVTAIAFDKSKNLWAATGDGLSVKRGENWFRYTQETGLASNDGNAGSILPLDNGEVFIGGGKGISRFLGKESGREWVPPNVFLSSLQFGGKPYKPHHGLQIPYGDRSMHVAFASPVMQNERGVRFQYRLSGYDEDWIETGKRQVEIGDLPPGRYHLEVRARNARGIWSTQMATAGFVILKPWYQRWWAYLVWAAMAYLVMRGVLWFRTKRLMRNQERLE